MPDRPEEDPKVITLSGRDIEDAKRLLTLLCTFEGSVKLLQDNSDQTLGLKSKRASCEQRAREILSRRRRRHEIFGKAMFGEPAWDMLLLLYVTEGGPRQTISRLADLAGASKSTAVRWMDYLAAQRLIHREAHPTDKRAVFVQLTQKGRDAVELYLSETRQTHE